MTARHRRMTRTPQTFPRKALASLVALMLALGPTGSAWADRDDEGDHGQDRYDIGLWGDLPYSPEQSTVGVPNLIADMNAQGAEVHGARRGPEAGFWKPLR